MSETRNQVTELVEEHLSRSGKDAPLIALVAGLAAIGELLTTIHRGNVKWGPIVLRLRQALGDTKAALALTQADASLDGLRAFAERQVAFAGVLEEELLMLEEGETTLA